MSGAAEDSHLQSNRKLPVIRGELALVIVILINSLGVVLMLYSGSGISAISSVPYAFSEVFPHVTLGTWTYIFQGLLILSLMITRKKFVLELLFPTGAVCRSSQPICFRENSRISRNSNIPKLRSALMLPVLQ